MTLKDKIGVTITGWLMPYITNDFKRKGDIMRNNLKYNEYCLKEKYLWFLGKEDLLSDFYMTETSHYITYNPRESYYYKTSNDIRKVHSGMPSLISYSKLRLLNSGKIIKSVLRKNGNEDKTKTEILNEILIDNNANEIIKKSILTESWGGSFAWKIGCDKKITNYPILEMYNPMEYKTIHKRGRLQAIIFINKIPVDKEMYELDEIYGKGFIDYELYQIKGNGERKKIDLSYLEETSELKRIELSNKDISLAGEKKNDKSDYDGIISEFDALDETYSQLMDEIRLGRSEVYVPENLLTNKTFDRFRKNFPVLAPDMKETGKNVIEHVQPDIRSTEYSSTINVLVNNILINVGLSPFTVGIDDGIGANSSGDSLTKREATSLRTRNEMVKTWEIFLVEMFTKLLISNDLFNKNVLQEYDVKVNFEEYITPSRDEIIAQTSEMVDKGIIDTEKAIDEIYGDMLQDEEKLRILANTGNVSFEEESIVGDEEAVPSEDEVEEVVSKTLNGAQTASLINIITQYKSGGLTYNQALQIIKTSIGISNKEAELLLKE